MMDKQLPELIHFIGIMGSGMSSLAALALKLGFRVQGSDISKRINIGPLESCTIKGSQEANGWKPASIVVYSSAISESNPELASAKKESNRGVRVMHRSEFLSLLMKAYKPILVTGTHGKSTTSSLITHVLDDLGCDPIAVIGARMIRYKSSIRFGEGPYFVAEADESDGTFLNYNPYAAVITNIDLDHLDHYGHFTNVIEAYETFVKKVSDDGFLALYWDQDASKDIYRKSNRNIISYGMTIGCEVRAANLKSHGMSAEFLAVVEREQVKVKIPFGGKHNILNALAALAVARGLKLDLGRVAESLGTFMGVERRLNLVFQNENLAIYDDYAHNPGKILASVSTLKEAFPARPLVVIFQPHRYSRLATMYDEMLAALKPADIVLVLPVYSAGEPHNPVFTPKKIADDLSQAWNVRSFPIENNLDISVFIRELKLNLPVILTCGAGDVELLGPKIAAKFSHQE